MGGGYDFKLGATDVTKLSQKSGSKGTYIQINKTFKKNNATMNQNECILENVSPSHYQQQGRV